MKCFSCCECSGSCLVSLGSNITNIIGPICCHTAQGDKVRIATVTVAVVVLTFAPCVPQKQIRLVLSVVKLPKETRSGLLQLLLL
jgi:hypothetical protein